MGLKKHPTTLLTFACLFHSRQHVAANEVDESWRKTHDKGRVVKGNCHRAWFETEGLLGSFEEHRRHCHERGEEDGHFHIAWPVSYQDPNETGHKGRSQECVR